MPAIGQSAQNHVSSTTPILSGTVNPFFIQPGHWDNINDVWIEGDYHVAPDSPYIDAGSPFYGDDQDDPTEDGDGNPRVVGERVDIGAYESTGNATNPVRVRTASTYH